MTVESSYNHQPVVSNSTRWDHFICAHSSYTWIAVCSILVNPFLGCVQVLVKCPFLLVMWVFPSCNGEIPSCRINSTKVKSLWMNGIMDGIMVMNGNEILVVSRTWPISKLSGTVCELHGNKNWNNWNGLVGKKRLPLERVENWKSCGQKWELSMFVLSCLKVQNLCMMG